MKLFRTFILESDRVAQCANGIEGRVHIDDFSKTKPISSKSFVNTVFVAPVNLSDSLGSLNRMAL